MSRREKKNLELQEKGIRMGTSNLKVKLPVRIEPKPRSDLLNHLFLYKFWLKCLDNILDPGKGSDVEKVISGS